jgi:hypothetical protein
MSNQSESNDLTDEQKVEALVQFAIQQLPPLSPEHLAEIREDFRALVAERRRRLEAHNDKSAEEKHTES